MGLGISIYPLQSSYEQLEIYRVILKEAQQLGMNVFLDINPEIVKLLKIDPTDFQFFVDLGVKGVRLDGAFNGFYEAYLTYNSYDIAIEINGSFDESFSTDVLLIRQSRIKFVST